MCLGDLGEVVAIGAAADADVVRVRTDRGVVVATRLLVPDVRPGDRVVVHSGHVLAVLDPDSAADATRLRRVDGPAIARRGRDAPPSREERP